MSCNSQTRPAICKRDSNCHWVNRSSKNYCRRRRRSNRSACQGYTRSICDRKHTCRWANGQQRRYCRRLTNRTRRTRFSHKKLRAIQSTLRRYQR
jgi:hypothetical protein